MPEPARTRWIRGAIEGSARLCLPLPWERGARRGRRRRMPVGAPPRAPSPDEA